MANFVVSSVYGDGLLSKASPGTEILKSGFWIHRPLKVNDFLGMFDEYLIDLRGSGLQSRI